MKVISTILLLSFFMINLNGQQPEFEHVFGHIETYQTYVPVGISRGDTVQLLKVRYRIPEKDTSWFDALFDTSNYSLNNDQMNSVLTVIDSIYYKKNNHFKHLLYEGHISLPDNFLSDTILRNSYKNTYSKLTNLHGKVEKTMIVLKMDLYPIPSVSKYNKYKAKLNNNRDLDIYIHPIDRINNTIGNSTNYSRYFVLTKCNLTNLPILVSVIQDTDYAN